METNIIEVGREELRNQIASQLGKVSDEEISEQELDVLAGIALAILGSSAGLTKPVESTSFAFDPLLRVRLETRLLDLFIAVLVGAASGTMVPSVGATGGAIGACAGYLVNCIPEIRNWLRAYARLRDSKARLVVDFIRASGPMEREQILLHLRAVGVPEAECASVLQSLADEKLIRDCEGSVDIAVSEETASVLRAGGSEDRPQKKTTSIP